MYIKNMDGALEGRGVICSSVRTHHLQALKVVCLPGSSCGLKVVCLNIILPPQFRQSPLEMETSQYTIFKPWWWCTCPVWLLTRWWCNSVFTEPSSLCANTPPSRLAGGVFAIILIICHIVLFCSSYIQWA